MQAIQQTLKQVFGVVFTPQATLAELRQYHHPNTYCCNAQGELIGIFSSENEYTAITIPAEWQTLEYLNLSDNAQLKSLTFKAALPHLQHLDGSDCKLESLIIPAGFDALQWLDASRNQLQKVQFDGAMPKLSYLDLSGNQLSLLNVPDCPALQYLYLNNNQIATLNFKTRTIKLEILHLKNNKLPAIDLSRGFRQLETLYLEENQIASIPPDFLEQLPQLKALYLKDNPIQNIAPEIFDKDENVLEDVRNVLLSLSKGTVKNNEVKMILVGNSTVGKTTLEKYLRTGIFEEGENTTHGIQVNHWKPENSNGENAGLNVYIWDFGGQEYYHATHRLFLSNNAVYCLLWNKGTNVQDIVKTTVYRDGKPVEQDLEHYRYEYWLSNIQQYAPDSPILLVQSQDEDIEVVDSDLFENYHINPKKNYQVCVKSVAEGNQDKRDEFSIFQRQLIQTLQATATKFELGKFWVRIRDEIRRRASLGEYRWGWEEYVAFCQNVDDTMQLSEINTLTRYLKSIGVILHYPEYPRLAETVFIKPTWVTDRIYEIFNEEVSQKDGEFDRAHIIKVLKDKSIGQSSDERDLLSSELLDLMLAFELIFSPKDKPNIYFAIQYLLNQYPNLKALERQKKGTPHLGFALHFPKFLPKPVFHRFIAEYGKYANDEFWKYGIFFTHEINDLEVFAECKFTERIIEVWSKAPDPLVLAMLFEKLFELSEKSKQIEVAVNGTDFISIEKLEEARELEYPKAKATNGNLVVVKDFEFCFGRGDKGMLREILMDKHKRTEPIETEKTMNPIQQLIAQARVKQALDALLDVAPVDYKNRVVQLQSRWRELEGKKIKGIISHDNETLEHNSITDAALTLYNSFSYAPIEQIASGKDAPNISAQESSNNAKIYFSYAWGDDQEEDTSREEIVNKMYDTLQKEAFNVQRDKMDISYGGVISEFMKELGTGDLIVVFVSDKYIKSPYCMFELYEIARNNKWDKQLFTSRILPVPVERIRFDDPNVLDTYFEYWELEQQKWEALIQKRLHQISESQSKRYHNTKAIHQNFGSLSDWLTDINASSIKLLSENDFEKVKAAIQKRLDNLKK